MHIELEAPGHHFDGLRVVCDRVDRTFKLPHDFVVTPLYTAITVYDPDVPNPPPPWVFEWKEQWTPDGLRIFKLKEAP